MAVLAEFRAATSKAGATPLKAAERLSHHAVNRSGPLSDLATDPAAVPAVEASGEQVGVAQVASHPNEVEAGEAKRRYRRVVHESVSSAPSRILVYGVTGSGKSVLAQRIGIAVNVPWYSVDDLTWEPGWVQVPVDDQRIRISAICAQERWILDSAYGQWLDIPLSVQR